MNETLTLSEFPPVPTAEWDAAVLKDFKGVPPKSRLFYRAEDLRGLEYLDSAPGEFPYTRGTHPTNAWKIRAAIYEPGVDEISLVLGSRPMDEVLAALPPCPVHFEAGNRAPELLEALAARPLAGSADYAPLADLARAASLIRATSTPQFRPVTVRAHRFAEAGAAIVQELGFAIAEGVEILAHLTDRGLSADEAAQACVFSFAVGSAYFQEIAKLRAARTLWARAVESFHPAGSSAARIQIHARTSHWTKTIYDPYVNLLRATTEAMAAIVGGADSLQVEPFDATYREPSRDSNRLALNLQLILRHEAWLDRSVDAAGGAYYIETLTDSLARGAWALLQQIEAAGGFLKYSESGALAREAAVGTRRAAIVGTNRYPNLQERMLPAIERPDPAPRAARVFEEIRLRTERHAARTGHTPRFLLLEAGDPHGDQKMRRARSAFCTHFFGCAGFEIEIAEKLEGDPDAVVLCSSDPEYAALAPSVIGELRAAGKSTPVIVAGYPADSIEELKQAGVADFVHIRSNAAETLRAWQQRLEIGD